MTFIIVFLLSFVRSAMGEACTASWYSTRDSGQSGTATASGRPLNDGALTAAHRTLPFGSKVRVTNKSNGQSVMVTINDRGPFVRGRCIDLTLAAKKAIGMGGTAPVEVGR